jgi:hypothetical protein
MRKTALATASALMLLPPGGATAQSAPPVGTAAGQAAPSCGAALICAGDVGTRPGNGVGDRIEVATGGANGSVVVSGGATAVLRGGTGAPAPGSNDVRPLVVVADDNGGPVAGTVRVTGAGSLLALRGNDTGAIVAMGIDPAAVATLAVENGGTLELTDTSVVGADPAVNRDVYLDVGQRGGTATVTVDGGTLSLLGNSNVGLGLGTAGAGRGSMTVEGAADVSIRSTGGPGNGGFVSLSVGRDDGAGNLGALAVGEGAVLLEAQSGGARLDFGQAGARGTGRIDGPNAAVTLRAGPDLAIARVGTGPARSAS